VSTQKPGAARSSAPTVACLDRGIRVRSRWYAYRFAQG